MMVFVLRTYVLICITLNLKEMAKSKREFYSENPDLEVLHTRMIASGGSDNVDDIRKSLKSKPMIDPESAVWEMNDSFIIPDSEILIHSLFKQNVRGNYAFGFHIKLENGACKNCYLSSFVKVVVPYKVDEATGDVVRNGESVMSDTQFGKDCRAMATQDDVLEFLLSHPGGRISVKETVVVTTANRIYNEEAKRYVVDGITTSKVLFWEYTPAENVA